MNESMEDIAPGVCGVRHIPPASDAAYACLLSWRTRSFQASNSPYFQGVSGGTLRLYEPLHDGGARQRLALIDEAIPERSVLWHVRMPNSQPKLLCQVDVQDLREWPPKSPPRLVGRPSKVTCTGPNETGFFVHSELAMDYAYWSVSQTADQPGACNAACVELAAREMVALEVARAASAAWRNANVSRHSPRNDLESRAGVASNNAVVAARTRAFADVQANAGGEGRRSNSTAHGVQVISVPMSMSGIYCRDRGHAPKPRQPYINALTRALEWTATAASDARITTVQLSGIDGFFEDGPQEWKKLQPMEYARFSISTIALYRLGVWVSAPTGNDIDDDKPHHGFDKVAWPASDPNVIAVGCAWFQKQPHSGLFELRAGMHRSHRVDILIQAHMDTTFTSYCNGMACAIAVVVKSILHAKCAVPQQDVPADLVLALMQETARLVPERFAGPGAHLPVLDPQALYARLNSTGICERLAAHSPSSDPPYKRFVRSPAMGLGRGSLQ